MKHRPPEFLACLQLVSMYKQSSIPGIGNVLLPLRTSFPGVSCSVQRISKVFSAVLTHCLPDITFFKLPNYLTVSHLPY